MSPQNHVAPQRKSRLGLRRRLLGLGALGGTATAIAAVVAMTTAGGVALIATAASPTAPAATAARAAAPAAARAATARTVAAYRPAASATTVMIQNYAFSPAAVSVSVGDTVTWTNMDEAPHTVTVSSGPVKFSSPTLQKGQSFSYTFTKAGTYQYYCAVHPDMKGSVTVTGSGGTPAPGPSTGGSSGMPMPASGSCGGAMSSLDAFLTHVYAGHLEESPGQQVKDITNLDQYTKTHTVLVENMLKPLIGGGESALDAFLTHVYAGHLEESPGQQVKDITNLDQYVKTHTVLVENMIKPLIGGPAAGC